MPLTRSGELKFVAANDLKGLGAKEGPAVAYQWTRPSLLPPLLPWLGMLLLLSLKPNRTARAWWIWLPLGCVFVVKSLLQTLLAGIPSEVVDLLSQVVYALAFGVAAIWLTAPFLGSRFRFVAFLKMLVVLGGICLFVWAVNQDWGEFDAQQVAGLVCLGVLGLAVVGALCLAGFKCRRKYRPARFHFWLALWLVAGVALAVLPFAAFAAFEGGTEILAQFGISIVVGAGVCFFLLLPFLILCLANHLYDERLRDMLRMEAASPPPVLAAPEAAPAATL